MADPDAASLIERLRQRKLVQWALAYLAAAWLVMQFVDVLGGRWGWPTSIGRATDVLLLAGLAVTLVLAWYHGEKGQQSVGGVELLMLAGVLVLAGAGLSAVRRAAGAAEPEAVVAARGPADPNSIAVLPFVNMSSDPEQRYFSDGLTEELLHVLARTPELRVTARTSSFAFRDSALTAAEIAGRLDVARIVEGSVRRAGDRIRITVQLIDAPTDTHLLSETYDRELTPENILELQTEISAAIANRLQLRAGAGSGAGGTSVAEAYDLYLRGLFAFEGATSEAELRRSAELFEAAIARDSAFALAYIGVARVYAWLADAYLPPVEAIGRSRAAAERALAIADIPEARVQLAYARAVLDWDTDGGLAILNSVLASYPNLEMALTNRALLLATRHEHDRALADAAAARRMDPLSFAPVFAQSWAYIMAARYEEAIELDRAIQSIAPDFIYNESTAAIALRRTGRVAEAFAIYERARRVHGEAPFAGRAVTLAALGRHAEAEAELARLLELERQRYVSPVIIGWVQIVLGHDEAGLAHLERAVTGHDANLGFIAGLDGMERLENDGRYIEILRSANHTISR